MNQVKLNMIVYNQNPANCEIMKKIKLGNEIIQFKNNQKMICMKYISNQSTRLSNKD